MSNSDSTETMGLPPDLPAALLKVFAGTSQTEFEIEFFRGILQRRPDYVAVLKVLSANLTATMRHREALEIDRLLVRLRPTDPTLHFHLACTHARLGQLDPCLQALRRCVDLGLQDLPALLQHRDFQPIQKEGRFQEFCASVAKSLTTNSSPTTEER